MKHEALKGRGGMVMAENEDEANRSALPGDGTKSLYDAVYDVDGHNYGAVSPGADSARPMAQLALLRTWVARLSLADEARVVEVGCGVGHLHSCHANWTGFEYSGTALRLAKQMHGEQLRVVEGDARLLPLAPDSVDFLFSFATLEHVPEVERAFAEIERVMKPGAVALLGPAWNCRPWTVKKLQQRPYAELSPGESVGKFLIPVRENIGFRMIAALPRRLWRELKLLGGGPVRLDYRKLFPRFDLWESYPHISDDDAFVSIDAHSALTFFRSRGWSLISHPTLLRRLGCRGGEILVRKPPL